MQIIGKPQFFLTDLKSISAVQLCYNNHNKMVANDTIYGISDFFYWNQHCYVTMKSFQKAAANSLVCRRRSNEFFSLSTLLYRILFFYKKFNSNIMCSSVKISHWVSLATTNLPRQRAANSTILVFTYLANMELIESSEKDFKLSSYSSVVLLTLADLVNKHRKLILDQGFDVVFSFLTRDPDSLSQLAQQLMTDGNFPPKRQTHEKKSNYGFSRLSSKDIGLFIELGDLQFPHKYETFRSIRGSDLNSFGSYLSANNANGVLVSSDDEEQLIKNVLYDFVNMKSELNSTERIEKVSGDVQFLVLKLGELILNASNVSINRDDLNKTLLNYLIECLMWKNCDFIASMNVWFPKKLRDNMAEISILYSVYAEQMANVSCSYVNFTDDLRFHYELDERCYSVPKLETISQNWVKSEHLNKPRLEIYLVSSEYLEWMPFLIGSLFIPVTLILISYFQIIF